MRALFKNRAGGEVVLTDVKFEGQIVTGTAQNGQRIVLRRNDLVRSKLLNDEPGRRGGRGK